MKRLLFTSLTLLFICTSLVHAVNIRLIKEDAPLDRRSIVIEPTAIQDGNIISISFPVDIQNVQVVAKDIMGNVIYTNTIAIPANQPYSFMLDNADDGDYILEVTYGDKYFYGYFTL